MPYEASVHKSAIETEMKRRYADALMALCEGGAALAELTVLDVTRAVGTVRQTFYRHFSDMDDLVCYVATRPFLTGEFPYLSTENVMYAFNYYKRHKAFFCQLPTHRGVNGFRSIYLGWQKKMVYAMFLPEGLEQAEYAYRKACIDIYEGGTVDALIEWLADGMTCPVELFVKALADCTPPFMRDRVEELLPEFFPTDYAR